MICYNCYKYGHNQFNCSNKNINYLSTNELSIIAKHKICNLKCKCNNKFIKCDNFNYCDFFCPNVFCPLFIGFKVKTYNMIFNMNIKKYHIIKLKISNKKLIEKSIFINKMTYCILFYNRTLNQAFKLNKIIIIPNNILVKNIKIYDTYIDLNIKNILINHINNIYYINCL